MKQWRRGIVALFIGGACVCALSTAWADVGVQGGPIGTGTDPINFLTCTTVQSDQGLCNSLGGLGSGRLIKGFKLIAGASNSRCGLYDAAAIPKTGFAGMFDELYEPTADDVNVQIWTSPYKLTTTISVVTLGAGSVCIIYY